MHLQYVLHRCRSKMKLHLLLLLAFLANCHGFVGNLGLHAGFMRRQEVPQNSVTFSRRFDFVYRLSFSGNIEFDEENW